MYVVSELTEKCLCWAQSWLDPNPWALSRFYESDSPTPCGMKVQCQTCLELDVPDQLTLKSRLPLCRRASGLRGAAQAFSVGRWGQEGDEGEAGAESPLKLVQSKPPLRLLGTAFHFQHTASTLVQHSELKGLSKEIWDFFFSSQFTSCSASMTSFIIKSLWLLAGQVCLKHFSQMCFHAHRSNAALTLTPLWVRRVMFTKGII